jgi:hypothetical protein
VQARRDGQPGERLFPGEAMHEAGEQGHGPFGVPDAGIAIGGQAEVSDIPPRLVAAGPAGRLVAAGPAGRLVGF